MLHIYVSPGAFTEKTGDLFIKYAADGARDRRSSFIIVPEQDTVSAEKRLLEAAAPDVNFYSEVINFSRLPNRVFREIGGLDLSSLTDGAKAVLMYLAVTAVKDRLDLYRESAGAPGFSEKLFSKLDSLKSDGITPDRIKEILRSEVTEDNFQLLGKLSEMNLIFSVYASFSEIFGAKRDDDMTRLAGMLSEFDFFEGKTCYINGFYSFTAPESAIVKRMIVGAKDVFVSVIASKEAVLKNGSEGCFSDGVKTYSRLVSFCRKYSLPFETVFCEDKLSPSVPDSLYGLSMSFFKYGVRSESDPADALQIKEFPSVYDEISFCAGEINRLIIEKGAKYSDFAVIFRNESGFLPLCRMIFGKYSIPAGETQRAPLSQSRAAKLLISAVLLALGNAKLSSVEAYLKSGMTSLTDDEVFALCDYGEIWNVNGSAWLEEKGFTMNPDGLTEEFTDAQKSRLEEINRIKEKAFAPVRELREKISGPITRDTFIACIGFLDSCGAYGRFLADAEALRADGRISEAGFETQNWNALIGALTSLCDITLQLAVPEEASLADMIRLAVSGVFAGRIPQSTDCVLLGQSDFSRFSGRKYVFSIGMNSSEFPAPSSKDDFFTQGELDLLSGYASESSSFFSDRSDREDLIFHVIASSAKERLYLTYSSANKEGGFSSGKSRYVTAALRLFPSLAVSCGADVIAFSSAEALFTVLTSSPEKLSSRERAMLEAYFSSCEEKNAGGVSYAERLGIYSRAKKTLAEEKRLTLRAPKGEIMMSQSKLNTFYQCRYSYFLKYMLKAKPRPTALIEASDIGSFIHAILERFFRRIFEEGENISDITPEERLSRISGYADEYLLHLTGEEASNSVKRLKRILVSSSVRVVDNISRELAASKFVPFLFEYDLPKKSGKALSDPEERIGFSGKADRADIYKAENGKCYIRVVDYKTSSRKFDLRDVYNGLNLQLLIYLFALCKAGVPSEGKSIPVSPAGVLYMTAAASVISSGEDMSEEELTAQIDKKLVRDGILSDSPEILRAMDKTGRGLFIPVELDGSGKPSKTEKLCSDEDFAALEKYVSRLLTNASKALRNGHIEIDPFCDRDISCKFCDFRPVCKYDGKGERKYVSFDSRDDVMNAIKNDLSRGTVGDGEIKS